MSEELEADLKRLELKLVAEIKTQKRNLKAAEKCLKCHQNTLEAMRFEAADYCPGCGVLRSQCDCWDAVNQG